MRVSFQGETGAYSEAAVRSLLPQAEPVPLASFEEVFASVSEGECDAAVVPIENSLFGSVHVNYDLLLEHDLTIRSEVSLRIKHNLMRIPDSGELTRIMSHPQALGQCKVFLRANYPHVKLETAYDTAGAAKIVAQEKLEGVAAIASKQAAEEYGLEIIASDIESNHNNYTRFLMLTKESEKRGDTGTRRQEGYKTSLVYTLKENVPGALFKSLAVFALREIDLFKIESRPLVGKPGRYVFYFDIHGSLTDEPVNKALAHLSELSEDLKILGSYPIGTVVE